MATTRTAHDAGESSGPRSSVQREFTGDWRAARHRHSFRGMRYSESSPPSTLAHWVHCFWFLGTDGPGELQPVVPDGRLEIVLHLAEPFDRLHPDGRVRRQGTSIVSGQLTGPIRIGPAGRADIVGIRFRTAGARAILGLPLDRITDRLLPLGDVLPALRERLESAARDADPVTALSSVLSQWMDRKGRTQPHVLTNPAVELLARGRPVAEVARALGSSERTLERRVLADTGLSPKQLQRVLRFRRLHGALRAGANGSVAAAAVGYYDQSHANRDFVQFAGCSPTEFFGGGAELASAILSDEDGGMSDSSYPESEADG